MLARWLLGVSGWVSAVAAFVPWWVPDSASTGSPLIGATRLFSVEVPSIPAAGIEGLTTRAELSIDGWLLLFSAAIVWILTVRWLSARNVTTATVAASIPGALALASLVTVPGFETGYAPAVGVYLALTASGIGLSGLWVNSRLGSWTLTAPPSEVTAATETSVSRALVDLELKSNVGPRVVRFLWGLLSTVTGGYGSVIVVVAWFDVWTSDFALWQKAATTSVVPIGIALFLALALTFWRLAAELALVPFRVVTQLEALLKTTTAQSNSLTGDRSPPDLDKLPPPSSKTGSDI